MEYTGVQAGKKKAAGEKSNVEKKGTGEEFDDKRDKKKNRRINKLYGQVPLRANLKRERTGVFCQQKRKAGDLRQWGCSQKR